MEKSSQIYAKSVGTLVAAVHCLGVIPMEDGRPKASCRIGSLASARVKRTAACAMRETLPHRLLRVLAAVLLLGRAIQPVSDIVGPTIDRHAGHSHLGREIAAKTHDPERHGDHDLQGCHFCRFDDIALPPPAVAFVGPAAAGTVARQERAQQTGPARPFLTCVQPRAPPRLA
jgi:hypothetical protein